MKRVDLKFAFAAGLAVAFPLYKILTLTDYCGSPSPLTPGGAVGLLAVLASYLSVPWLFGLLRIRRGARFAWLWTAVLGSLPCAVALYCLRTRSVDWGLERSVMVWAALCLWTLPFAAAVYYSGVIIRGVRGPKGT